MALDEARSPLDRVHVTSSVRVGCPRCTTPVVEIADGWSCPEHGVIVPVWRPTLSTYDGFAEHLQRAGHFPTYLPWPLGPGWTVTDFAAVTDRDGDARATMTCVSGTSQLDGPVDVLIVAEEAGIGLGARIAGLANGSGGDPIDPGHQIGHGSPEVRVRVESRPVGLWPISVSSLDGELDRSVLVGEAEGRWLWLVLRPASAMLLLRDDWLLRDISTTGPGLVALPFGGPAPAW